METKTDVRARHDRKYVAYCMTVFALAFAFLCFSIYHLIDMGIHGDFAYFPEWIEGGVLFALGSYMSFSALFVQATYSDGAVTFRQVNGTRKRFDVSDSDLSFYASYHTDHGFVHGIVLQVEDRRKKKLWSYSFVAEPGDRERIRMIYNGFLAPLGRAKDFRIEKSLLEQLGTAFTEAERQQLGIREYRPDGNADQIHLKAKEIRKKRRGALIGTAAGMSGGFLIVFVVFAVLTHLAETGQIAVEYEDTATPEFKVYVMTTFFTVFILLPIVVCSLVGVHYHRMSDRDIVGLDSQKVGGSSWHHEGA